MNKGVNMIKWLLAVPPEVGSWWDLRGDDPFCGVRVVIKATKGGYVQYTFEKAPSFPISKSIRVFRSIYKEDKS